jgi:quercetin dioxygenase-like cupin family protein
MSNLAWLAYAAGVRRFRQRSRESKRSWREGLMAIDGGHAETMTSTQKRGAAERTSRGSRRYDEKEYSMQSTALVRRAIALGALFVLGGAVGVTRDAGDAVRVMTPGDITWTSVPGYPPGYARAMLEGEVAKAAPCTYRVRLPAAFKFQPHTHDSDERVTVLQGTWSFGVGETFDASRLRTVPTGTFVTIPAGTPHFVATEREAVIQVHGVGPIGFRPVTHRGASDDVNR